MQMCGIGSVSERLTYRRAVVMEILVMMVDPLGFDLLMRIDATEALGKVSISKSGKTVSLLACQHQCTSRNPNFPAVEK